MDYQKLVDQRYKQNPFANLLGIRVTEIKEGFATAEMTVLPEHANPLNSCHGGVLMTLADVAAGAASLSLGYYAVTLRSDYNFLHPVSVGTRITAAAKVEKGGHTINVIRVETMDADKGELVGTGCFTYFKLDREVVIE